jgi:GNAT superfamily N-acetyltransferase
VAKSDGKIVGTVSYTHKVLGDGKSRETLEYRRNKKYHIWGMAVLPEYRRRGIGEQLLHEAERDMYKKNGKGYFGLAFSEEVAQWYVRTSGVRLRRLSPRYLTTVGVPFTKNFRQNGALEDMKKRLRYVLSLLLKRLHANPKAILERERSSRLPKEG